MERGRRPLRSLQLVQLPQIHHDSPHVSRWPRIDNVSKHDGTSSDPDRPRLKNQHLADKPNDVNLSSSIRCWSHDYLAILGAVWPQKAVDREPLLVYPLEHTVPGWEDKWDDGCWSVSFWLWWKCVDLGELTICPGFLETSLIIRIDLGSYNGRHIQGRSER